MINKITLFKYSDGVQARFDTRFVTTPDSPFNGRRVKHLIYKEDAIPGCYWHEVLYLSEFDEPEESFTRIVSERVFFGKYRLVRERKSYMKDTWLATAECIKEIEKLNK